MGNFQCTPSDSQMCLWGYMYPRLGISALHEQSREHNFSSADSRSSKRKKAEVLAHCQSIYVRGDTVTL